MAFTHIWFSKVDRIWGFDRYLVVCVIISLPCSYQNIRRADKKTTVVFQQPRPGPKLPKGENYFTIGWKQVCGCMLWLLSRLFSDSSGPP